MYLCGLAGITLSLENDGVWMYNRSDWPVFVNSPSLNRPGCRTFLVYRVPAGHCFRIFCPEARNVSPMRRNGPPIGPVDPNSVRISFAKGWGPKYHRQEITACPTWLEVLLSPCRWYLALACNVTLSSEVLFVFFCFCFVCLEVSFH